MAESKSLDATFFAFRKREKGGALTSASIGFGIGLVILLAAFGVVLWLTVGPLIAEGLRAASAGATGKPGDMTSAGPLPASLGGLLWIFPAEILFLFFVFLLMAAYEAACHRWMIRGEASGGFMGLNLSADTWRVYATYWVWFGLLIGFYIACAALMLGVGGALFGGGGDPGAGGLIMFLLALALILGAIYGAVRLAPAAATSVGRGRFSFFKAWSVTRGRFWAMFGAFLLLILINIVVGIILSTIAFSVLFAGAFANLDMTTAATNPDAFAQAYLAGILQMFTSPTTIAMLVAYQLVAGAISLVFYVLFFGVNARAVQAALAEGKIEVAPAS